MAPAPCPRIVANALPPTPQCISSTNIQFRMMQTITLTTFVRSANFGAPAVRMKLFIPIPIERKKNPKH